MEFIGFVEFVVRVTKVEKSEDTKAWQEVRALVGMVYEAPKFDRGFFIQYLLSKDKHPKNPANPKNSTNSKNSRN